MRKTVRTHVHPHARAFVTCALGCTLAGIPLACSTTGQNAKGGDAAVGGTGGGTLGGAGGSGGGGAIDAGPPGTGGASGGTGGRMGSGGALGTGGNGSGGNGSGGSGSGGRSSGTGGGSGGSGAGGAIGPTSGLPTPPGSGGVARPTGTPGNLTVIDWSGFKGAVSYTFDDTNSSQIAHYNDLQALGVPMTFYLITGKAEATSPIWRQALQDGHELGNHTQTHLQAGTAADVDAATTFLQQTFGITVWTMASPYGDPSYPPLATTRFLANRGVANGLIAPNDNTDPFNLFCYVPPTGAAATAFNTEIDAARNAGRWKIVLVHGFDGGTDGAFQPVSITEFTAGVAHAKAFGDLWIDTVTSIAAYWRAQKLISGTTPVVAGTSRTWTWVLPAHFPPGRFLRVRIDGGTLSQGSTPITWNDHGYFEIALDRGSLTLGP